MRKFLIICVIFGAVCTAFQKQGQKFIKSMGYAQRDDDPNSSTRRLASKQRVESGKQEALERAVSERNSADFNRRMVALGVLPLNVPLHKMAVYVFNDSAREITFSLVRADGQSTGNPDIVVVAGGCDHIEIPFGGVVYIWAKGTLRRWRLDMATGFPVGGWYGGCVFKD